MFDNGAMKIWEAILATFRVPFLHRFLEDFRGSPEVKKPWGGVDLGCIWDVLPFGLDSTQWGQFRVNGFDPGSVWD